MQLTCMQGFFLQIMEKCKMRRAFWKNFAGLQRSQLKLKTLINLVLRS